MNDVNTTCLSTGNRQMDEILHGGFPVSSINVIMGQPGTGKTIFAEQMVFNHAKKDDRPILYLTTLSEPAAKVLAYLQRFTFFDEEKVGTVVHYQDIGFELAKNGISVLLEHLKESIHTLAPKIIVVDSFMALHDIADSRKEMRCMLSELTGLLTAYETTVFLVGEYNDEHARTLPEFAIADGIIEFKRSALSTRDERFLRVLKLRGSAYIEGLHGFRITSAGLDVYPRLISPVVPESYANTKQAVRSGIEGFDQLAGGGLREGSTTLLAGPTGSGKTTFALQFALEGIREKQPTLYVNFQENPSQLKQAIKALGSDLDLTGDTKLEFLYSSPVELQIDSIIVVIFRLVEQKKLKRVIIDSIGDLALAAIDPIRLHGYLYALSQHLVVNGVSSMLTYELDKNMTDGTDGGLTSKFSNIVDNIILLARGGEPDYNRVITCLKARGCNHELKPRNFAITDSGISLR